jgi:cysteine desulfurase family protein (TIGR01976 family)
MPVTDLDITWVRSQFPSLNPEQRTPPVFFDNPGGTQVPTQVIEAVSDCYRFSNANIGGAFETSRRAGEVIDSSRAAMAALLNAPDPNTIIFGNNMTSLTFHVARSIAETIRPGDEIIVTDLDHDANVTPWVDLEANGAVIRRAPIDPADCTLSVDSVSALISERTRLVAITHASNAVGTIPDVAAIVKLAHSVGALAYVDAVQYAPHRGIDVTALDCDFLVCSSYKFFGPHAGILYGKRSILEGFKPHKVRPCPPELPHCWETGTQNHEGIAGIGAAVEYLAQLGDNDKSAPDDNMRHRLVRGMDLIADYESKLCRRLIAGLQEIGGIRIYGITDHARSNERLCTVAFTWDRFSPVQIAAWLGNHGIYCWSGNYYALRLMETLGLEGHGGAVRIGPAHYNTAGEIDLLLNVLCGLQE